MNDDIEPVFDIAQLGHVEILTPRLEDSIQFFTDVYGLYIVAEDGPSVHLRGWNDDVLTSLKVTAAKSSGVAHVAWRTTSNNALERRVAELERRNVDGAWIDGDVGHGRAYRYLAPGGHHHEVYYESEKFTPTAETRPFLPNQPQRFAPKGVAAARIDHINLLVQNVAETAQFHQDALGFKVRERLLPDGVHEVGSWLSVMSKAHDLALTREEAPTEGRLHHLAFALESREEVLRAADIFMENEVPIDFGPAKHSRTQGFFLYVIEPGGNRIEVFAGGIHIYAPDFETVTWTTEAGGRGTAWGLDVPPSFHSYATPPYPPE